MDNNFNRNRPWIDFAKLTADALEKYRVYLSTKAKEVSFEKSPFYADNDYLVYLDGKLDHYLEVKVRTVTKDKFPDTKVPLRKHATAEHYFNADKIKTYFLCIWSDTLGLFDLTQEPTKIETTMARSDRGQETDVYAFYNVNLAEEIK